MKLPDQQKLDDLLYKHKRLCIHGANHNDLRAYIELSSEIESSLKEIVKNLRYKRNWLFENVEREKGKFYG